AGLICVGAGGRAAGTGRHRDGANAARRGDQSGTIRNGSGTSGPRAVARTGEIAILRTRDPAIPRT
ncbi:MAG: hypothetical protein ACREUZ_11855, partial [Burkholderiales bacterium]